MTFSDRLVSLAGALSNQRHLSAIRNGFFQLMPLILVASFYVLLNNVILAPFSGNEAVAQFKNVGDAVFRGSLGILSLLASVLTAYHLAEHYKMNGLIAGTVGMGCFIAILPGVQEINGAGAWGVLTFTDTSASSLFVAMLVSLLSVEVFRFFMGVKALIIRMPDSVPPAIAKSFNALIPILFTMTAFGLLALFLNLIFGKTLNVIIAEGIQAPLVQLVQNPLGVLVVLFVQNFLWFFGLHGAFVLGPITEPTYLAALQQNIDMISQGGEAVNIVTKPFLDAFANMGGGGNTIGLIIALILFSKKENEKTVGGLGLLPGLFNINEPLIFGLPIVLNPIYGIPFVLVPMVNTLIAYIATSIGFVAKTFVQIPWTTPPIISGYLATGGDIKAALLSVALLALSVVIYMPFVFISNRVKDNVQ